MSQSSPPKLDRALGTVQATALNVANMIGTGPFITIPLFLAHMNGPHALVAWVLAALLVFCDGLVWSELGAALPGSGGTYHYLREAFGKTRLGRLLPFLFIWQFLVSGALEMASGYIGAATLITYVWPGLEKPIENWQTPDGHWVPPVLLNVCAAAAVVVMTLLLCRPIRWLGRLAVVLVTGTLVTVLTVIVAGLANFNGDLITLPTNAFPWTTLAFYVGLGGSMKIAIYDYLGYYNICHLGEEVRAPHRTIPRAVMLSVVLVAAIYLTMNVCLIGVVPWQEAMKSENLVADFMERLFGRQTAVLFTALIIWTALAGLYAMLLGYSRIPYAAARNGDFLRPFAWLHPVHHYPAMSLFALGALTALFCFIPLKVVIDAAVTIRILVQFIAQIVALHLLRTRRPDVPLPFRMWLYPLPALVALIGWTFVLVFSDPIALYITAGVYGTGVVAFACTRRSRG